MSMKMQNTFDGPGALGSQTVELGALGVVTVVASERAIVAITFGAAPRARRLEPRPPGARDLGDRASGGGRPVRARSGARERLLAHAARELEDYVAGARTTFSFPFAATGTPFQREVWAALSAIPFGETRSYADVARAIGRPRAVRAVGAANGKNPLSIVVPCHRVIGGRGDLTGYSGGLPRKAWLLAHERARGAAAQSEG
jgi:methylated-DNA-[protein]-cysteine S-methyltransferase